MIESSTLLTAPVVPTNSVHSNPVSTKPGGVSEISAPTVPCIVADSIIAVPDTSTPTDHAPTGSSGVRITSIGICKVVPASDSTKLGPRKLYVDPVERELLG